MIILKRFVYFPSAILFCLVVAFLFFNEEAKADGLYHMTAGEAVDLKWDRLNVWDCRGANNYYNSQWGSNNYGGSYKYWAGAGGAVGMIAYAEGTFTKPGSYSFGYNCQNDEDTVRYWDIAQLRVYPAYVLNTSMKSSCSATVANMTWDSVPYATSYLLRVTKPSGESCPTGWDTFSSTVCTREVSSNSAAYKFKSGTNYPWEVASKSGSLVSAVTSSGGYSSQYYTPALSVNYFKCTTAPSVDVHFE